MHGFKGKNMFSKMKELSIHDVFDRFRDSEILRN